jgi:hypothetical protein
VRAQHRNFPVSADVRYLAHFLLDAALQLVLEVDLQQLLLDYDIILCAE